MMNVVRLVHDLEYLSMLDDVQHHMLIRVTTSHVLTAPHLLVSVKEIWVCLLGMPLSYVFLLATDTNVKLIVWIVRVISCLNTRTRKAQLAKGTALPH